MGSVDMNVDVIKKSMARLPAFPATIHKVTQLINDPDSSLPELVQVIRLDQAITANILRMCNSAYFGLRHKVDNVQDAVMYMGRQNIVRAVLAAGSSRFFKDTPGYEAEARELWEHAVGTALMAQILSKKILKRDDSRLFTAALLHDIGKIVMGEFVKEKYSEFKTALTDEDRSFLEAEETILGMNHAELGGIIAGAWNFPKEITQAISGHHRPDLAADAENQVTWIVHLADQACLMLGIGRGTDGLAYRELDQSLHLFGLSPKDLEAAMATLVKELEESKDLVGIVQEN